MFHFQKKIKTDAGSDFQSVLQTVLNFGVMLLFLALSIHLHDLKITKKAVS